MIKVISVVGARPQFIKAAAISRAVRSGYSDKIQDIILHTGQHYDDNMSKVFFDQLNLPVPRYNLGVGSAPHGVQTARMILRMEPAFLAEKPDVIILYGDTNSTLAGAITASKLDIPVAHVEAGLRSFNRSMPEEINRIVCDHVSTLLFCPSQTAVNNLKHEGFMQDSELSFCGNHPKIFFSGDVMYDNALFFSGIAKGSTDILNQYRLASGEYLLATIHRDNNTDQPERLNAIFSALYNLSEEFDKTVIIPLHPRTTRVLKKNLEAGLYRSVYNRPNIIITQPLSFFDMMVLERNAQIILTDSGGVQKEAFFYQRPCIILRPETEWIEIIEHQAGIIADADPQKIREAYLHYVEHPDIIFPPVYGNGKASEFICREIAAIFN
ncbi:MAG: UDP-N-acetylglucosamine 2-epimerase (non-hydrolyzing) [Bacteroidetes bacterium]|nr:UDP-N-acetylglucosamine 2-epimerase (non-hydrolyzing) [Bacteroidota bacterium]